MQTESNPNRQFHWPLRVYYEDTDAGGIVFYANYLRFFERARTEWLRACGVGQQEMLAASGAMFVVANANLQFHASARLDDLLQVEVEISSIRPASIAFTQRVLRAGTVLCSGEFRVGCVQQQSLRPCPIPTTVLQAIKAWQANRETSTPS